MARGSLLQSFTALLLVFTAIYVAHNVVTHMLQVDGGYSSWSEFSSCTVSCGGGTRQRWRACTNPLPKYGGRNCSQYGLPVQTFQCNRLPCPVHGGYGAWTDFSPCSATCGGGVRKRTRPCDNPKPQFGGKSCQARELGPDTVSEQCNTQPCPVNGGYGQWSEFNACSATCGGGIQIRIRSCDQPAPQHGGKLCSAQPELGPETENKSCNADPCPVNGGYGVWGSYDACSVTCGAGTKTRTRKCNNPQPQHGGQNCKGPGLETESCNSGPCPVDGGYSDWSNDSSCSVTCGGGTLERRRTCDNPPPSHGGKTCVEGGLGPDVETHACNSDPCPLHAGHKESSSSNKTENKRSSEVKSGAESDDKVQQQQSIQLEHAAGNSTEKTNKAQELLAAMKGAAAVVQAKNETKVVQESTDTPKLTPRPQ